MSDTNGQSKENRIQDNVYDFLRHKITTGAYPPGKQLKESHIADELDVSRTPVRLALRRLIKDGLLTGAENRGAFVAQWTHADVAEVYMLRILLESQAAGLAAERATSAQVARLRALTDQMHALITEKPHNYLMDLQVANNGFHEVLLEASASPRLVQITENLLDAPLLNGGFYVYSHDDMLRSVHHHRDIILAIENRDAELAKHAMKTHLRASYHTLIQGHSSKDAE